MSTKTIHESNLDLECTKSLKVDGNHIKNKMADITFLPKVSP